MFEPIMANYTPEGDDWAVEVTAAGETRTATAPGLIAARDAADQLVEELVPDDDVRTVVHTLEGDAFEFTSAYLAARLGKRDASAAPPSPREGDPTETAQETPADGGPAEAKPAESKPAVPEPQGTTPPEPRSADQRTPDPKPATA